MILSPCSLTILDVFLCASEGRLRDGNEANLRCEQDPRLRVSYTTMICRSLCTMHKHIHVLSAKPLFITSTCYNTRCEFTHTAKARTIVMINIFWNDLTVFDLQPNDCLLLTMQIYFRSGRFNLYLFNILSFMTLLFFNLPLDDSLYPVGYTKCTLSQHLWLVSQLSRVAPPLSLLINTLQRDSVLGNKPIQLLLMKEPI